MGSYQSDNTFLRVFGDKEERLTETIKHYLKDGQKKLHLFTFAWEKRNTDSSVFLDKKMFFVDHMASDSTILVIIGYSFPYFNREVDRQIFYKLKASGKLKKVYFQDPFLDGSFLRNQFELGDIPIEHVKRTDSFFVPWNYKLQFHIVVGMSEF